MFLQRCETMSGASAGHVLVPVFAETTVQCREGFALQPHCVAFRQQAHVKLYKCSFCVQQLNELV